MRKKHFLSTLLLVVLSLPMLVACGGDDDEDEIVKDDGGLVVIDNMNIFYDHIKYYIYERHLVVSGYDEEFNGIAKIPSTIDINGYVYEVLEIDMSAFQGCSRLTSVIISDGVTTIYPSAFRDCPNLASVTIGNSMAIISSNAFSGCPNLNSISIPSSVTFIGSAAFRNTGWYNKQGDGILYLDNWLLDYKGEKPTGDLVINNGTKRIAAYAFRDCTGLTSVSIPNSVISTGYGTFNGCTGLTSVTIPNGLTYIDEMAFSGCTGLTSVDIPNSVTIIDLGAFSGCTGLTSIIIPNSVTELGNSIFEGCTGLTTITIGNSVAMIYGDAFRDCSSLNEIHCKATTPPTCWYSFGNDHYSRIKLYVPKGTLDAYKKADFWKNFQTIIEE